MSSDLKWLGLSDAKVKETLKNSNLTKQLCDIVKLAKENLGENNETVSRKELGSLLYQLGSRIKAQCAPSIPLVVRHICNKNIRNEPQLSAAIDFMLARSVTGFQESEFLQSCGAGVIITPEQIEDQVAETINKYKEQLLKERYRFNVGRLLGDVKSALMWADGAAVKREVDLRIMLLLGPKTEEDYNMPKKKAAQKAEKQKAKKEEKSENEVDKDEGAQSIEELMLKKTHFHKVGENYKTDGYVLTPNTMLLLKEHVKAVGGKVVTRFPPEPNGILHIGHAKAININFGYAKAHGGICYLRFDDTNPEKEEEKFFKGITDMVEWLGYKPYRITHSSDYFDQLYKWAVVLIKKNLAYVCHQKVEEMRGIDVKPSPWRDRPIEESLFLFEKMRQGMFEEGAATLRLKIVLEEGKVDPVAYRIKYCKHHRTGNRWCIYPTYDFTHCLCDSIENITHSLCTKEFQSRRSSYYWLCNALDIYCPVQWEYGRLNMYYSVVSKRRIKALIEKKIVSDWDDPRLFTLTALRRRGIPPEAINNFVANLGLTMAQMFVDPQMLDAAARDYLNTTAPRTMAVLDPLKLVIENYDEMGLPNKVSVPDFPAELGISGSHDVSFDKIIFIEKEDYRKSAEKGYRRLTEKQPVGLKHLGIVLSFVRETKDSSDQTSEVIVRALKLSNETKPKAFIHWVAKPATCEVRLYDRLFMHQNPEDTSVVPDGFLSDCNLDSCKVLDSALIDAYLTKAKVFERFQFERLGFFAVDKDSTPSKLVFNRTVGLREDSGKN
uniref:Probable glutamine--tRNA ligase n=1 Tax=Syphacia muris TaxID=451379 RepID=A0A0N5APU4_9BILA